MKNLKPRRRPAKPDPLFVIELFMEYREKGMAPPDKVLDWLALRFDDYLYNKGKKTLDESFGLTPKAFKNEMFYIRDRELCFEIFFLQRWFGLSADHAAGAVSEKLQSLNGYDRLGLKINREEGPPEQPRLLRMYGHKWKKIFNQLSQEALEPIIKATAQDKLDFINSFPRDSINVYILPKLLKSYPHLAKKVRT